MADNANVTQGDGTIVVATDKIGGVDYQRIKMTWGADGTATDASAAAPIPVVESALEALIGEVQATPTANTLLRRLKDLLTGIVLAAGSAIIGKVGIDQTTPGTTDSVSVATGQGAGAAIGATTGAAVITDVNGTIQQYLRGLVKLWIAGGLGTKEIRSATPTQSSVADTASSTTLLASNSSRLGATVFNDSTVVLYLKLGATASTTSYTVQLAAGGYFEIPFGYTGIIDGIWASDASGNARITELAA